MHNPMGFGNSMQHIINPSLVTYQEIHPRRVISIESVKSNTYLEMMRECEIHRPRNREISLGQELLHLKISLGPRDFKKYIRSQEIRKTNVNREHQITKKMPCSSSSPSSSLSLEYNIVEKMIDQ